MSKEVEPKDHSGRIDVHNAKFGRRVQSVIFGQEKRKRWAIKLVHFYSRKVFVHLGTPHVIDAVGTAEK